MPGFVRPYAIATQGIPRKVKFDRVSGDFELVFDADPTVSQLTEIFVPRLEYPHGCEIEASGGKAELDVENQRAFVKAERTGEVRVVIRRRA